jgi:outer membrane protein assembly factor BamB
MRFRLIIFALLAVFILAGCVGTRMGVSWPTVDVIELNGEQQLVVSYEGQVDLVSPENGKSAPLLNSEGEVRRDEDNNARKWSLLGSEFDNAQFFANPIHLDEDKIIVADYNNRLIEIDTIGLSTQRVIPLDDHVLANILVDEGVMYVPLQATGLTAIQIDDYEVLWTYPVEEGVWAEPLLVDDMIVVTSPNHHMYAIDKVTGEFLWEADLEGAVASKPLLANDRLYIGSFNRKVFEVTLDGEIRNTYETQNWVWGTPAIDDEGILFVADLSGYVHALDTADDLSVVWSSQIATRGIRPGPLLVGDKVVVASRDGFAYWVDRQDGLAKGNEIEGNPELLSDLLLIEPSEWLSIDEPLILISAVDTSKLLIAFDVDGNNQVWVYGR